MPSRSAAAARLPFTRRCWWRLLWRAVPFLILACSIYLRAFVLFPGRVISPSMVPTLRVGDFVFVHRTAYRDRLPRPGEIVAFYSLGHDETWMKRAVAGPGDWVELRGGVLYRNGQAVPEPYARWSTGEEPATWRGLRDSEGWEVVQPEYVRPDQRLGQVPPGSVVVMGDNRSHSDDSRHWGPLHRKYLIGRAILVFWPPRHFRWLE